MLRHLIVISAVLVIGLGVSGPAASETTSDSVNLPREQALARQVKALKTRNAQLRRQVKTLNRRVRTLRDKWADARREGALTQEVLEDTRQATGGGPEGRDAGHRISVRVLDIRLLRFLHGSFGARSTPQRPRVAVGAPSGGRSRSRFRARNVMLLGRQPATRNVPLSNRSSPRGGCEGHNEHDSSAFVLQGLRY